METEELPIAAKLALPGYEHTLLAPLAGEWMAAMQMQPTPDADIIHAQIKCTRTWLIDGRYLQEELTGELAGAPYERVGLLTFHRLMNRFQFFTADNLDTGFMPYEGKHTANGLLTNRIELFGQFIYAGAADKLEGLFVQTRYVIGLPENGSTDHFSEMYFSMPGADEYRFCRFGFKKR